MIITMSCLSTHGSILGHIATKVRYSCQQFNSRIIYLHHPTGSSVNSALFYGFYNGGLRENIFWSVHKWNIRNNWKISNVARVSLIWNIMVQYYYCVKCHWSSVCILQNNFLIDSHFKISEIMWFNGFFFKFSSLTLFG